MSFRRGKTALKNNSKFHNIMQRNVVVKAFGDKNELILYGVFFIAFHYSFSMPNCYFQSIQITRQKFKKVHRYLLPERILHLQIIKSLKSTMTNIIARYIVGFEGFEACTNIVNSSVKIAILFTIIYA